MKEKLDFYESIRREYPEVITKDQFYRIAHISKATALFLLQSGKVPCKDSGKKTRRYKIRTDDVILYLIDREINPANYRAPDCWYKGRSGSYKSRVTYRNELSEMDEKTEEAFRSYITGQLDGYGDLLTVAEASEFIGYCDTSFHRWCAEKRIKAFNISGRYLIPKLCFVDFLASPYSYGITRKTWKHLLLIKTFLDSMDGDKSEKCSQN